MDKESYYKEPRFFGSTCFIVGGTLLCVIAVVVVGCSNPDAPEMTKWIEQNGDVVQVVQVDGIINEANTMFVAKSIKTGETCRVSAHHQAVVVGETWIVWDKLGQNGYHREGYLSFKEKVVNPQQAAP